MDAWDQVVQAFDGAWDAEGYRLKEHLLSRIPRPGKKSRYFKIMGKAGKVGSLSTFQEKPGHVEIESFQSTGGPHSLGHGAVRNLMGQAKAHFPGVGTVGGHRSSGMRKKFMARNRQATVPVR
jgi:hypothetical protein